MTKTDCGFNGGYSSVVSIGTVQAVSVEYWLLDGVKLPPMGEVKLGDVFKSRRGRFLVCRSQQGFQCCQRPSLVLVLSGQEHTGVRLEIPLELLYSCGSLQELLSRREVVEE